MKLPPPLTAGIHDFLGWAATTTILLGAAEPPAVLAPTPDSSLWLVLLPQRKAEPSPLITAPEVAAAISLQLRFLWSCSWAEEEEEESVNELRRNLRRIERRDMYGAKWDKWNPEAKSVQVPRIDFGPIRIWAPSARISLPTWAGPHPSITPFFLTSKNPNNPYNFCKCGKWRWPWLCGINGSIHSPWTSGKNHRRWNFASPFLHNHIATPIPHARLPT